MPFRDRPFAPAAMAPAAEMRGAELRFGAGEPVFSGVDAVIQQGEFAFLTGLSGAGKTSLLRLLYLDLPPSRGSVRLFGQPTQGASRKALAALRRRVGVVFQDFRLLPHLTAYENTALPLRVRGQSDRRYRQDVEELLHFVQLGRRMDAYPRALSGGEQQRVAIARALVHSPDLVIADEPTGNVDPDMARRLMTLFIELSRQRGAAVLVATHDYALVDAIGAPVLRLANGSLVRTVESGGGPARPAPAPAAAPAPKSAAAEAPPRTRSAPAEPDAWPLEGPPLPFPGPGSGSDGGGGR